MRSLWLAKKANRSIALKMHSAEPKEGVGAKLVEFIITERRGKEWVCIDAPEGFGSLESTVVRDVEPDKGTVKRGSATCPVCGYTTPVTSVRQQLSTRRGGAMDARLFCVVTKRPDQQGRFYRLPTQCDSDAIQKATKELERRKKGYKGELSLIPDEPTPSNDGHRAVSSVVIYGMDTFGDLFTPRQVLTLTTLARLVRNLNNYGQDEGGVLPDDRQGLDLAIKMCLALVVDRQADYTSSMARWHLTGEKISATFGRQALPMIWDFAEVFPFSGSTGEFNGALEWVVKVIVSNCCMPSEGHVERASAIAQPLPDDAAQCFFTDPPYYDSVPYADLADFFYVWLKRTLTVSYPDLFVECATPKKEPAIVWHPNSLDERKEYEAKMGLSMAEGRRILNPHGVGIVVFAHKSTSGWESQLQAMVDAGWVVTGSWPIDTEMGSRMNAMGTASLASSVHLVCRPRENEDGSLRHDDIGDWRDILRALPVRIHEWLPRLADEGVVGADAIFACLGPALEIFSRYSRVEKASGEVVTLREYLEQVWAAVSNEALALVFKDADTSGFEEDARLTAMWLWTLGANTQSNIDEGDKGDEEEEDNETGKSVTMSGYTLEYDAARKIAQGLGARLEALTSLVEVKGDKATLLPVLARTRKLFGKEESTTQRREGAKKSKTKQLDMFVTLEQLEMEEAQEAASVADKTPPPGTTILDRVHQTMILFSAGRSEAMKRFLVEDGIGNDVRFWSLAQALSALYPSSSNEKRWVDGILARKKGLGF